MFITLFKINHKFNKKMRNSFPLILAIVMLLFSGHLASESEALDLESASALNCANATTLYCGSSNWVYAPTQNHLNLFNYNFNNCFTPATGYDGKDHIYYLNVGTSMRNLTVTVNGLTGNMDLFLFKACSDNTGNIVLGNCVQVSSRAGNSSEHVNVPFAVGEYYIVVDGPEVWDNSGYEITVSCGASPNPHGCTTGTNLACGATLHVPSGGNNSFDSNDYDLSHCTHASYGYEGVDHVFTIDLGYNPRNITINMTGLSADLDMFLFQTCTNSGGALFRNCVGISTNAGNQSETITLYNASGTYILIVDGFTHWVTSDFHINLSCAHQPPPPPPPTTSCHNASQLYCGDRKWVNAPTHNKLDHHNYDFSGCYGPNHYYNGNDHLYKIDVGSSYRQLAINMSGLSADMDMFLFKSCGTHYGSKTLSDCVDFSARPGIHNEQIIVENAHGVYYLSVDSDDPWYTSGYEIEVDCHDYAPDPCYSAKPLHCGDRKWVHAPTHNHLDHNNYDYSGCLSYGYGYTGKDHLYVIDAGNSYKDLTVRLTNLSADLDLLLYRRCGNHYGQSQLTECLGYSVKSGTSSETLTIHNAHGTYYLAVDSNDPWYTSGYEISLDCHAPVVNPCHYAAHLECGDSKWVDPPTYNHLDYRHYEYNNCLPYNNGYTGYDHLYVIDAGYDKKDVHVKISQMTANLDLLLYRHCNSGYGNQVLTECLGYSTKSGYQSEEIIIKNARGKYYLVVDAYDPWHRSGYKIKVECHKQSSITCYDAEEINCGDSKWVTASRTNHLSGSDYDFDNCGYVSSYDYTGYDHLYKIDLGYHEQHLVVELTNLTDNIDLLVFESCGTNYQEARLGSCAGVSQKTGRNSEKVEIHHASGTYYIAVDARSTHYASDYKIKVHCTSYTPPDPPDPPHPDPDPSIVLQCGESYSGTTVGEDSDFDNSDIQECFSTNLLYTGPDQLVAFEKPEDSDILELVLVQEDANLSLFVLDSDMNFVTEMCRGANFNESKQPGNSNNVGEVYSDGGSLAAGQYYALIEGYNRTIASAYTLYLSCGDLCATSDTLSCEASVAGAMTSDSTNLKSTYMIFDSSEYVGYAGGEWTTVLTIDTTTDVTIDMFNINADGDLDLFVLYNCVNDYIIASSRNGIGEDESLTTELTTGEYLIVVDGWKGASGSFDLEITGCGDPTGALLENLATSRNVRSADLNANHSARIVPNPFSEETRLLITMDDQQEGRLELLTTDGRLIHSKNIQLIKGRNVLTLSDAVGDNYGIILYRLVTDHKVYQGTMIRVR